MTSIFGAKKLVWGTAPVLGKGKVKIVDSLGRVLAKDVTSDFVLPSFDRSAKDGYPIISEDTSYASGKNPVFLEFVRKGQKVVVELLDK